MWDLGSKVRDKKGGIWNHSPGIRISNVLRDQGSGCTIFMGSGTKNSHGFVIKGQKLAFQNGISNEKTQSWPKALTKLNINYFVKNTLHKSVTLFI